MYLCLIITVAYKCSALLIAIDNINTVCEIALYLTCKKFTIITDHSSLQWLMSKSLSNINARLARWVLCLSQYNFTIIHKAGTAIPHADALSRQNYNNASEEISFAVEPDIICIKIRKPERRKECEKRHPTRHDITGIRKFNN